jgi:chromosome segregation ATPase
MATEKSETDETKGSEQEAEKGKGNAGDVDPEVAELQKDPARIKSVLKALAKANKEAETRRLQLDADEKKALEEQGKFKELAERAKTETQALKDELTNLRMTMAIEQAALEAGATKLSAVSRVLDRSGIKASEDAKSFEGVKEAIDALKKEIPELFGGSEDKGGDTPPPDGSKPGSEKPKPRVPGEGAPAHEDLSFGFSKLKK